jgi:hypothetical protein
MRFNVQCWLLVTLLAFAVLTSGCRTSPDDTDCIPTYWAVADHDGEDIEVPSGIGISVAVIGCKSELESLTEFEKATIFAYCQGLLYEKHFAISNLRESVEFRLEVSTEINSILHREVVTDIYIPRLWYTDFSPPPKSGRSGNASATPSE